MGGVEDDLPLANRDLAQVERELAEEERRHNAKVERIKRKLSRMKGSADKKTSDEPSPPSSKNSIILREDRTQHSKLQLQTYPQRLPIDQLSESPSTSSVSTNFTLPNLPGPGRALGNLYTRAGRILERSIALLAHKMGYGPYAVSSRVGQVLTTRGWGPLAGFKGVMMDDWRRMLRYIENGTPQTRVTAIDRLLTLLTHYPIISNAIVGRSGLSDAKRTFQRSRQNIVKYAYAITSDEIDTILVKTDEASALVELLIRCFRELELLKEKLAELDRTLHRCYSDAPTDWETWLDETFADAMRMYADHPVRESVDICLDPSEVHSAVDAIRLWWSYVQSCNSLRSLSPRMQIIFDRAVDLCTQRTYSNVHEGGPPSYDDPPPYASHLSRAMVNVCAPIRMTIQAIVAFPKHPAILAISKTTSAKYNPKDGHHHGGLSSTVASDRESGSTDSDSTKTIVFEEFRPDARLDLLHYVKYQPPRVMPKRRLVVDEIFIADIDTRADSQLTFTNNTATPYTELVSSESEIDKRDMILWYHQVGEQTNMRGEHDGNLGTFVHRKWDVSVLPGRVIFASKVEGEPSDGGMNNDLDSGWIVEEKRGRLWVSGKEGEKWWTIEEDGTRKFLVDFEEVWLMEEEEDMWW